jgi:hypothetical protein
MISIFLSTQTESPPETQTHYWPSGMVMEVLYRFWSVPQHREGVLSRMLKGVMTFGGQDNMTFVTMCL